MQNQENKTRDVITMLFESMSQRNLTRLSELFADQVDWEIPGDVQRAPWVGKRENKTEVCAFYRLLWKNTEPISASVETVMVDGHQGIVIGEFTTKMLLTDKIISSFFCIHIALKNNLIYRYRLYENTLTVSESLAIPAE
ncbi:nuclear transport factor 2 family protein [Algoriphagus resistens]|uniref:nuclear transport factor 2 family protein n=1 Tax=Algoriphagus resistens TaxID=1750590 RepID=UPI0007168128|nr:nuclear transport factor 2 family protein [Algoriphagus resistens]